MVAPIASGMPAMDIDGCLCGGSRELLYQLAAQFRWYLVNGRNIASLEYLLDRPSSTLCKTEQVIDLLRRSRRVGIAVLLALVGLVLWLVLLVVVAQ